jgi:hypothetical protein
LTTGANSSILPSTFFALQPLITLFCSPRDDIANCDSSILPVFGDFVPSQAPGFADATKPVKAHREKL